MYYVCGISFCLVRLCVGSGEGDSFFISRSKRERKKERESKRERGGGDGGCIWSYLREYIMYFIF